MTRAEALLAAVITEGYTRGWRACDPLDDNKAGVLWCWCAEAVYGAAPHFAQTALSCKAECEDAIKALKAVGL